MAQILLDTNVLIYLHDQNSPKKQDRAIMVLSQLEESGTGSLSAQVLAEFSAAAIRKLRPAMTAVETDHQTGILASSFPVFDLTPAIVLEALRGVRDHGFSYYDAQVWATARLNQIPVIFSEDFQSGQIIEGVRFVNPFSEGFEIDEWI